MPDMIDFPKDYDEFLKLYLFKDSDRIYTNGPQLIPLFRVYEMIEHYFVEAKSNLNATIVSLTAEKIATGTLTAETTYPVKLTCTNLMDETVNGASKVNSIHTPLAEELEDLFREENL